MEALNEDHRTDLYSLGIVFWTLLVGRGTMPFEGGPLELLHAIVQKRPMPVHEVRRDVPQVLASIIDRVSPLVHVCSVDRGGVRRATDVCLFARSWHRIAVTREEPRRALSECVRP